MVSAPRDGLEVHVALGLLADLATWEIVTYAASGPYPDDAVRPAYLGATDPPAAPDDARPRHAPPRRLTEPRPESVVVPVGIAWRGPVDGDDTAGLNFLSMLERRLYRLPARTWGEARIAGARRADSGLLPRDAQRRPRSAATYLFRCRMATVST